MAKKKRARSGRSSPRKASAPRKASKPSRRRHSSAPAARPARRRGRSSASRGSTSLGTLLVAGVAGVAGLVGAVMLRDHLPDSLKDSPTKTGLAIAGAGVASGALLDYLGYRTAAIAAVASMGAAGGFEAVSPMLTGASSSSSPKPAVQPSNGQPGGNTMPVIGPVSPTLTAPAGSAIANAQQALGGYVNTLLGYLGGQPQQQSPGAGAYPTYPQLPQGYQDPIGAAQGIATTIAQHVDYGQPAPSGGGSYPIPGGVLPPDQWPVGRVVPRANIGRVVMKRIGCVNPVDIGRVVRRA